MDDNKKNGPEFAPLKEYNKDFPIIVDVYDRDDKVIRTERMNYGNRDDRVWLGKLTFWALSEGHMVETRKDE